jgi:hypothetical protein
MTNKERLTLAKRVQKNLQKKLPQFSILVRKKKIEEGFKREEKNV